jgi:hypothetical protein
VLDKQDTDTSVGHHTEQDPPEPLRFGHVKSGRWLVEQQDPEWSSDDPAQLDQPALARRKVTYDSRLEMLNLAATHRILDELADSFPVLSGRHELGPGAASGQKAFGTHGHVLSDGHRVEQLHPLERPTEAKLGPRRWT